MRGREPGADEVFTTGIRLGLRATRIVIFGALAVFVAAVIFGSIYKDLF